MPMAIDHIVFAQPISGIWQALGGDAPRRGRARAFFRGGDNSQAISLNDARACWYDHRDHVGGGVLDLVQHVLGFDGAGALRWLSDFVGLPLVDRPLTLTERRDYARRRVQAIRLAHDVADWERGLELFFLESQNKAAVVISWMLTLGLEPGNLFTEPARSLKLLRGADADSLVHAYRELPEAVRRPFREAGRRDREHAEAVTRAIVSILSHAGAKAAAAA